MDSRDILYRILKVLKESGYRRRGIEKRVQEHKNLIRSIYEIKKVVDFYILMASSSNDTIVNSFSKKNLIYENYMSMVSCVDIIECFFDDLNLILNSNIVFDTYKDFLCKIFDICGYNSEHLFKTQNSNRMLLKLLYENPEIYIRISYVECWIEENEIFFTDLSNAINYGLKENPSVNNKYKLIEWVGNNYEDILIKF